MAPAHAASSSPTNPALSTILDAVELLLTGVLERATGQPTPIIEDEVAIVKSGAPSDLEPVTLGHEVCHRPIEAGLYSGIVGAREDPYRHVYFSETVECADADVGIDYKDLILRCVEEFANAGFG